jgi:SAM-dependent methyltransferase
MGLYAERLRPRLHDTALGPRVTGAIRERVCAGLGGDVLEIGFGSGHNLPHLPPEVTGVWAVEPSAGALRLSEPRRAASAVAVVVAGDDARALPFPDGRFDAALCTWVLCGVPGAAVALAEVARVLRPGGVLHLVEHGRAPDPGVRRLQRLGNPVNRAVAGCVLDNDVEALLAASPLTVTRLAHRYLPGGPRSLGSLYEGRAVA